MIVLNQIFGLVKLLNSERGAWSIASGLALGMILGFVPSNPLITLALLFLICIFRINMAATMLAWAVFTIPAYLLDHQFDQLGYYLLTGIEALKPLYTKLYNMPIVPWSRFNNTVVMGSFMVGVIMFLPMLFLSKWLVERYRVSVWRKFTETKVYKALKSTKLFQLYEKYDSIKGALS